MHWKLPNVIHLPDRTVERLEGRAREALARLSILERKLDMEGAYTRALSAGVAMDVIKDLVAELKR